MFFGFFFLNKFSGEGLMACPTIDTSFHIYTGNYLTQWPLGDVAIVLKVWFSNSLYWIVAWAFAVELLSNEYHRTSLMRSQRWFRRWKCLSVTLLYSTLLVQVMAWCCLITSHYLSQCWPRSMSPYGVNKLQWVNTFLYFYPRPILAFGYCRCLHLSVCMCGNHNVVRTITHHPFKLGSPNLNHRYKSPWLSSLLFWGAINIKVKFDFKCQIFWLHHYWYYITTI